MERGVVDDSVVVRASKSVWIWSLFVAFLFAFTLALFGTLIFGAVVFYPITGAPPGNAGTLLYVTFLAVWMTLFSGGLYYAVAKELRQVELIDDTLVLGGLVFSRRLPIDQFVILRYDVIRDRPDRSVQSLLYTIDGRELVLHAEGRALGRLGEALEELTQRACVYRNVVPEPGEDMDESGSQESRHEVRTIDAALRWRDVRRLRRRRIFSAIAAGVFTISAVLNAVRLLAFGPTPQILGALALSLIASIGGWIAGIVYHLRLSRSADDE
jgi:hypothetical protein